MSLQRINTLRLLLRCSPRTSIAPTRNQQAVQLTETLASDIIDSAVGYLSLRNHARPWSTYLTLLLIDISLRVAPVVKLEAKNPTMTAQRVMLSLTNAQDCLRDLTKSKLNITRKALARLNEISQDVNCTYALAASVPRLIDNEHALFWSHDEQLEATIASVEDSDPVSDGVFDASKIWNAAELADLFFSEEFLLDDGKPT